MGKRGKRRNPSRINLQQANLRQAERIPDVIVPYKPPQYRGPEIITKDRLNFLLRKGLDIPSLIAKIPLLPVPGSHYVGEIIRFPDILNPTWVMLVTKEQMYLIPDHLKDWLLNEALTATYQFELTGTPTIAPGPATGNASMSFFSLNYGLVNETDIWNSFTSTDEIEHRQLILRDHPELHEYIWLKYGLSPDLSCPQTCPRGEIIVIKPFINFGYGFFSTPGALNDLLIMNRFENIERVYLHGTNDMLCDFRPFAEYLKGKNGFVIVCRNTKCYDDLTKQSENFSLIQQKIFRKLPKVIIVRNPKYDNSSNSEYQSVYVDDPAIINALSCSLVEKATKGVYQEFIFDSQGISLKLNVMIDYETNPPHQGWNDTEKVLYEAACKGYGDFVLLSRDNQKFTIDSLRLRVVMPFFNGLLSGQFRDSGSKRYQTGLSNAALTILHQLLYGQLESLRGIDHHTNQVADYLDVLTFLHQHMCVNERMLYITTNYLVHNFQRWSNFTAVYQLIFDDPKLLPPEVSEYTSWLSRVQKNLDQLGSYVQRSSE